MRIRCILTLVAFLTGCLTAPPQAADGDAGADAEPRDAARDAEPDDATQVIDTGPLDRDQPSDDAGTEDTARTRDAAPDLNERACERETTYLKVDPTWSFLRRDLTETRAKPGHVIALSDEQLEAGDPIHLGSFGTIRHNSGDRFTHLNAVFSDGNIVLAPQERNRVPGAIETSLVFESPPTATGLPTDIPEDFEILPTGTVVTIPDGAAFLIIGLPDEFSSNNYVEDDPERKPLTLTIECPDRR